MSNRGGVPHGRHQKSRSIGRALSAVIVAVMATSCAVDAGPGDELVVPTRLPAPLLAEDVFLAQGPGDDDAPLLLDEEFDGTGLNTDIWNFCHWWDDGGCTIATNNELEWYLPGQVQVRDGVLRLTAERRDVTGADGKNFPYVSGMVSTGPPVHEGEAKLAFTYGTVEVRFRAPLGAGLWPAIWMLPASERSKPEIDIFEAVGQLPHQARMYFHPKVDPARNVSRKVINLPPGQDLADTHTVRLQWSPDRLDFFFDGRKVWEVTGGQVPDEPMYLVMNLAVGGEFGGPPNPSAFPATFEIDYARVWSEDRQ